jgi:beta-lactamase superfamily II metal-dependent hydrolase
MRRALYVLVLCSAICSAQELKIYAIDVEGGKSTLYVSPSGESMLVDTGYDGFGGRDAKRIAAAAAAAGLKQIDYLVITHYHADHVGGVPQLAHKLAIRHYVDHGKNFETVKNVGGVYNAYAAQRSKGEHIEVGPGDTIPLTGVQVQVVTASGNPIRKPLAGAGAPNPACGAYHAIQPDSGENSHSIGLILTFGKFRLSDLGDLYWNQEHDLVCPDNLLGTVDVYMTTHHAKKTSGSPQMVLALHPRVAVMNNGPASGGSLEAVQTMHASPGLLDLWQLHYSEVAGPAQNSREQFIANPGARCNGKWILVSARQDGSFTVRNARNGFEKNYEAH